MNSDENFNVPKNFGPPSQEYVSGSFPESNLGSGSGFQKNPDTKLLEPGLHPAIIYGYVDLGSQKPYRELNDKGEKNPWVRKCMFGFEFPQLRQMYNLNYSEPMPATSWKFVSILISEASGNKSDSHLYSIICAAMRRRVPLADARKITPKDLLGCTVMVNVVHKEKNGVYREEIKDVYPINSGFVAPEGFEPVNEKILFELEAVVQGDDGKYRRVLQFNTPNYGSLMNWQKTLILQSEEAIAYNQSGGKFASYETKENVSYAKNEPPKTSAPPTPSPVSNVPAPASKRTVKTNPGLAPIEEFLKLGWTLEQVVQQGYGEWVTEAPAVPQTPPLPPASPADPPTVESNPVSKNENSLPTPSSADAFEDDNIEDDLPF